MSPRLPPPDPHESLGMEPPDDQAVPTEAVIYVNDAPSVATDRMSDAWLRLRPGVLVVTARA
jgi:hypothetical protein